jgi:hypothetical protein
MHTNALNGTIPSTIGQLIALTDLYVVVLTLTELMFVASYAAVCTATS